MIWSNSDCIYIQTKDEWKGKVYYSNNINNSKKELGTESERKCKSTQMEGQALLNRHSDEDCSGCKVEQAKELGTDRSFQNVSLIWIIIISTCKRFPCC